MFTYSEEAMITIISNNGSSFIDFEALNANETKTKKIKFNLRKLENKREMEFTLKITSGTTPDIAEGSFKITVLNTI